jgi:cytosine/adenosine deaminase-related metal-dependent hydrolase
VFELAALSGAKALRIGNRVGSIETGKDADLVLLDDTFATPATRDNIFAQPMPFGKGSYVITVVVRGRRL